MRFEAGGLPCGDDERVWQHARDVVLTAVFGSALLNPGRRCLQMRRRRTPQRSQAITQYPVSLRMTEPKDIFLAVTLIGQVAEPDGLRFTPDRKQVLAVVMQPRVMPSA